MMTKEAKDIFRQISNTFMLYLKFSELQFCFFGNKEKQNILDTLNKEI